MTPKLELDHPIEYIGAEYKARRVKNPDYTLRQFAQDLGVSVSGLSELLNGKRGLTRKKAAEIADKLDLIGWAKDYFCAAADYNYGRSEKMRELARQELEILRGKVEFKNITEDSVAVFSEWHYISLYVLLGTKIKSFEPEYLASRLNISVAEVKRVLNHFTLAGIINVKDGQIVKPFQDLDLGKEESSRTVGRLMLELLDRARAAALKDDAGSRNLGSLVLGFNPEDYERAIEKIRKFYDQFYLEFDYKKEGEVFCLNSQFFQLSCRSANDSVAPDTIR